MNITNHQLVVEAMGQDGHTKFSLCADRKSRALFLEARNGGPEPELVWQEGTINVPCQDRVTSLLSKLTKSWMAPALLKEAQEILEILGASK